MGTRRRTRTHDCSIVLARWEAFTGLLAEKLEGP
jgi:hypothetical protein